MGYRYATVFEAVNDGTPPNDGIEAGDRILELGKQDNHRITYLDEDNEIQVINFERVARYDHGKQAGGTEILDAAKKWYFEEREPEE